MQAESNIKKSKENDSMEIIEQISENKTYDKEWVEYGQVLFR